MTMKKISCLAILAAFAVLLAAQDASAFRGIVVRQDTIQTFNAGFTYIPTAGTKDVYPYVTDLSSRGYVPQDAKIHMRVDNPTLSVLTFTYYINDVEYGTAIVWPKSSKVIDAPVNTADILYGATNTITFETSVDPKVTGYLTTTWNNQTSE